MKLVRLVLTAALFFGLVSVCFAVNSKTITVTASVPSMAGGLDVNVSKIRSSDNVWLITDPNIPIDFGTLSFDTVNNIFVPLYYYAVDVGVNDNTGGNWNLLHEVNSIQKDALNNLDGNVNVTFLKQTSATNSVQLLKTSFGNSNGVVYSKANLTGGWLRMYYGIGTGQGDAPGVTPIGTNKPAGTYTGSVRITLTQ